MTATVAEQRLKLEPHGHRTRRESSWLAVLDAFHNAGGDLPAEWRSLFQPLIGNGSDLVVVGQLGQSLDGRIATENGHSKYINGDGCLNHLHRLRAVCDAVVVGVGTALHDDPQLTVRRVVGPSPARVVVDPRGRLGASARLFRDDGVRRIVLTAAPVRPDVPEDIEVCHLPAGPNGFSPQVIRDALAETGFRRILVEGGGCTISRFIAAGCLDRLHLLIAPVIIGAGPTGLDLPPILRLDEALRPSAMAHRLGDEVLFDCDLREA